MAATGTVTEAEAKLVGSGLAGGVAVLGTDDGDGVAVALGRSTGGSGAAWEERSLEQPLSSAKAIGKQATRVRRWRTEGP